LWRSKIRVLDATLPLDPGDLLFIGWDSDNDDIAFVATTDLNEGEVIYFTDDERDGKVFVGSEQLIEWTVPTGGVAAGTVVLIDMDPGAHTISFDLGGAVDYIEGGYQIAGRNEMFWAYQGTRIGDDVTPTNFMAVIANEANGSDLQTPNLAGPGLTTSNGVLIIDGDEGYMEWTAEGAPAESLYLGPRAVSALSAEARDEKGLLFAQLFKETTAITTENTLASGSQQNRLIERHLKNEKILLELLA
jgi:hypothetical protein